MDFPYELGIFFYEMKVINEGASKPRHGYCNRAIFKSDKYVTSVF